MVRQKVATAFAFWSKKSSKLTTEQGQAALDSVLTVFPKITDAYNFDDLAAATAALPVMGYTDAQAQAALIPIVKALEKPKADNTAWTGCGLSRERLDT